MVQALFVSDSASFSWKYDIDCFDAVTSRIHASTQNVFAVSHHLERLNRNHQLPASLAFSVPRYQQIMVREY